MGLVPAPPLDQTPTFFLGRSVPFAMFTGFQTSQKFGDGPLLLGPCIIIMTLPTTDDIWITAPLFRYPSLPFDHSTVNYILFGPRPL